MRVLIVLISFIFLTQVSHATPGLMPAKKKKGGLDKSRILIGPGIGIGAGNRSFSLNLSPSVAYCFSNNFHAGTTLGFSYFQAAEDYRNLLTGEPETFKYKFPSYSWSIFGRYILGNMFILNVEPEINNTKFVQDYSFSPVTGKIVESSRRIFVPSLLLGAGYCQRLGDYGYTAILAGYDVIQNPNARYYQTIDVRFAIMLDLFGR